VILALAAALALGGLPGSADHANAKRAKAKPLYWGATIGSQITGTPPPWNMRALFKFERAVGKKVSILSFSAPFADCSRRRCSFIHFPQVAMERLRRRGTIPLLSWASQSVPTSIDEPGFQLADVSRGRFDPYIEQFALNAAQWGKPFFLRLNPEMNGFWFPWSEGVNGNRRGSFVRAWRHIHRIFERIGATNATWVWCPNVDFERRLVPMHGLYPGDRYVDWTCLDGFNWGETPNSRGWLSFDQIFRSTYRRVIRIAPRKPMLIGEVASDDRGGSKARWIRNMLRVVPARYRKVRGLLWYDEPDQGMHWTLENAGRARQAFLRGIRRKIYRPNVFRSLPSGPIRPPGAEAR
jgi:hypothetical protein